MRIGIDACTWANRRGYGRFTRMLVSTMIAEYPEHQFVLVLDSHTAAEGEFPKGAQLKVVETNVQPTQAASADGARSPADLWKLSRAVSRLRFDAFVFPTSYSFYPLFCKTPTVVVFHDAIAEQHPKLIFPGLRSRLFWKLKNWLALRRANRLVTVSEDARAHLAAVFRRPASAIQVISEGPDPCFQPLDVTQSGPPILEKYGLPTDVPLILYVGGISPHKNLQGLLGALARIERSAWHLVLVGDYAKDSFFGCYDEVLSLSRSLGLVSRVTFTGYVPDANLVILYNLATMLVLPSLGEGFGLPIIEAMACGLPVAASNRNSLPEIIGEAGLLFDPLSHAEVGGAIERLLNDESLRSELRNKGRERAKLFSWTTGARKLVSILEEAATGADTP
ncbi:MAG: glycosyltransferase family 4 protein [Chthoniobacterales bacterium]|nr:glycosyltransferase family 4 protein [Chthoniobacterales bacterium]